MSVVRWLRLSVLAGGVLALVASGRAIEAQVPEIPATFYGSATIDGQAPPEGSAVRGFVDGRDCTQPGAMGTIRAEEVGAYVISVMHESQQPGCGREGAVVTFRIAGREAGQTGTWRRGPQELGLNVGSGEVQPLPADVPVPTSSGETPGAGQATLPGANTPRLPGSSTDLPDEDDGGLGVAGWALIALALIALTGGAAGWAMSRRGSESGRRRGPNDGEPL